MTAPVFDLDAAWAPHPQVALRPEPFGALLYHFGSRRLSFLKDPVLTEVVRRLAAEPSARAACHACGLPEPPDELVDALAGLAATDMIVTRPAVTDREEEARDG